MGQHVFRQLLVADEPYDGTNGVAIAADSGATIVSDNGTTIVLTFDTFDPGNEEDGAQAKVPVGGWFLWEITSSGEPRVAGYLVGAQYTTWLKLEEVVAGIATDVAQVVAETVVGNALGNALITSSGSAPVAAGGLLGQTQVIDVSVTPQLPDTNLTPMTRLRGAPDLLSGHGVTQVEVVDVDTVQVTVESGAAAVAGAQVHVFVPWLDAESAVPDS